MCKLRICALVAACCLAGWFVRMPDVAADENIALFRPVFASGYHAGAPPTLVNDGNNDTVWNSGAAAPAWLTKGRGVISAWEKYP